MKQSTNAWLTAAEDDLMAIESLLSNASLTHIVAFHAQQAIEKSLKALYEEWNIPVIRTHNLETLFSKVKSNWDTGFDDKLLAEMDRLYLDARYPGDFGLMPYGKPTYEEAKTYYEEAKRFRDFVVNKLMCQ
jgi:HEPN domain-containing protein